MLGQRRRRHVGGARELVVHEGAGDELSALVVHDPLHQRLAEALGHPAKELAPDHQPQYSLAATIDELRERLLAMGFRDGQFRASQLMRLRVIAALREQGELTPDLTWATAAPVPELA